MRVFESQPLPAIMLMLSVEDYFHAENFAVANDHAPGDYHADGDKRLEQS
mgnify:CR=1 FL=1